MSEEYPALPPLWSEPVPMGHNGGPSLDDPRRIGRPAVLTPAIRERLGELLLEGIPLRVICRTPGMPSRSSIYKWRQTDPGFARTFEFCQNEGYIGLVEAVCAEVEQMMERCGPKVARWVFNMRRQQLARMNPAFFGDRAMRC